MNVNYDDLGDVLEYGAISDNEAIEMCDNILKESLTETDDIVLESMFHAVYMGVSHRDIASKIDIDLILEKLECFSEEVQDYVITIMARSGKQKYTETIKMIGQMYPELDIDDALNELRSNFK